MPTSKKTIYSVEGLRAVAVLAVIAFHLFPGTFTGGFLGVDLFFVISGYVITALLADQVRATGEISFKKFYQARARRLLPVMATVVGTTLALTSVFGRQLKDRALGDLAFIFSGTYNWHLSRSDISYFDDWAPPLFQHLWSLSVEAQFYMLWPLILAALTWRFTSKQIATILFSTAIALSLWFVIGDLFNQGAVSHGYFLTQIHLASLLVGSALGLMWRPEALSSFISSQARTAINYASLFACVGLALMLFLITKTSGHSTFGLSALLSGLLLATAVHPASRASTWLSSKPLVALGRRSYSLYLWHWPVALLVPDSLLHAPVAITLTLALSELSFRYVEEPFRTQRFWASKTMPRLRLAPALPTALLLSGLLFATALAPSTTAPAQGVTSTNHVADTNFEDNSDVPPPTTSPSEIATSVFVGDSVLLGIRSSVPDSFNMRVFDGVVGRQAPDVLARLKTVPTNLRSGIIVINLGNNGTLSTTTTKWIFENLKNYKNAVVINTHVPRAWQTPNNTLIESFAAQYPTVKVANWHSAATGHPEYFGADGIHLTAKGAAAYIATISAALNQ